MNNFFDGIKKVHFVGVGGVSMSKLCAYTMQLGIACSGSDAKMSDTLTQLEKLGAKIVVGESVDLAKNADLVVYSSAIKEDNKEITIAKKTMERKEYLAQVAKNFDKIIAISGAHGKTITTSLLAWICKIAGKKFTAHIGGDILGVDNLNFSTGNELFITEACEYSKSFLQLHPDIGVVLNVDYDHPDCYGSLDDTYLAFAIFALQSKILVYGNDYSLLKKENFENKNTQFISFGGQNANYTFKNMIIKNGSITFDVFKENLFFDSYTIYTVNPVNVYCALSAIVVSDIIDIDKAKIKMALATFPGVKNRFQCLGIVASGARLIVDYAHHPRQIKHSIKAGLNSLVDNGRLYVVFEPHTYSRTKALFDDFCNELVGDWSTIIMPTFSARENSSAGYDSIKLYKKICEQNEHTVYVDGYDSLKSWLKKNAKANDLILCLGAGLISEKLVF